MKTVDERTDKLARYYLSYKYIVLKMYTTDDKIYIF
jgi:hypothetical protein